MINTKQNGIIIPQELECFLEHYSTSLRGIIIFIWGVFIMNAQTKKTVFKVVSIIFIVFGVIALIGAVVALIGAFATMALHVGAGLLVLLLALIALASGLLELLAGIWGVQAKDLNKCQKIGMIVLVLTVISIILSIIQGSFGWTSLIGLVLAGLYVYCLK